MNNHLDGRETYKFFVEAQTRQIADWLVGMNLSPLFSLQLQKQGLQEGLGIGRVQSPTAFLDYKRQKEIENFNPEPFYELESVFKHEKGSYKGKANIKEKNKEKVHEILKNYNIDLNNTINGTIKEVNKTTKEKYAPYLHSLSTLQEKANKLWKYTPKKTLQIAQSLYEKAYLSYPRSESIFITESEHEYLVSYIEKYQSLINVSFEAQI